MTTEEPAYMMVARANAKDGYDTRPSVVKALLERIDALEKKLAEKPSASDSKDAIEKLAESGALLTRKGWVTAGKGTHDHEEWQTVPTSDGRRYCRACGEYTP